MFDIENMTTMRKLLELLKSYKNYFDSKNAKTLFEHENENHAIDLIFDAKLLYKSLYILSEIELDVLKNYLFKNSTLNCIRESTSRANVLMFFVFIKKG